MNVFNKGKRQPRSPTPPVKLDDGMNQLPGRLHGALAAPMTRRSQAKQRTRLKLLDATRRLVAERGYEAATIRDIAAAADLSTGAVFASFTDKADLFNEVIVADDQALFERMESVAVHGGEARAVLLAMFMAGYGLHLEQLRLVQASISFSWLRDTVAERRNREGVAQILDLLGDVLRRGVERGELAANLDAALTGEMLWNSYVANYRQAIFDGWRIDALRTRLAAQIKVLLGDLQAAA
jgi:AcrR family transcriptional regulator